MTIERLFEDRQKIGQVLSQCLEQSALTKTEASRLSGISRPTLNRLLRGEINSRTNFVTHMNKLLPVLKLTVSELVAALNGGFEAFSRYDGDFLELTDICGKKALFRASIGLPDEESGEITWHLLLGVDGKDVMFRYGDGKSFRVS